MEVNGVKTNGSNQIILSVRANKLLNQGCEDFLAYVINSSKNDNQIRKIRTMCEFPNVFLEKLSGLPPNREVDFAIEVFFDMTPVSIVPYLMEPTKLKELKIQLQDLLDCDFIRPSISHWGAPLLFFKKKDGFMRLHIDYR